MYVNRLFNRIFKSRGQVVYRSVLKHVTREERIGESYQYQTWLELSNKVGHRINAKMMRRIYRKMIEQGKLKQIQLIVKYKMFDDFACDNNYAIRWASRKGHLDVVEFLASLDDVDASDDNNYAIRWASMNGHLDVVKFLASLDDVDVSTSNNFTIRWASGYGHLDVVEFLASLDGVDASANDNHAIRWASEEGHLDVVEFLASLDGVDVPT